MQDKVEEVLDKIRPALRQDGGSVELVELLPSPELDRTHLDDVVLIEAQPGSLQVQGHEGIRCCARPGRVNQRYLPQDDVLTNKVIGKKTRRES